MTYKPDEAAQAAAIAEMRADAKELNAGKIDIEELKKRQYHRQKKIFLPKLQYHRQRGQWQEFIKTALSVYEILPEAFSFYNEIPDNLKYDFAIRAYINHGDSLPEIREAIKNARKYGSPELPPELLTQEAITVYRAGEETAQEAAGRISWTTDIKSALFFFDTWTGRHAKHIFTGMIKPCDIIAYTNERDEHEIIQYNGVYNIQEIDPEQS